MKIAYINFIPYDNVYGVEKKLKHQAIAAKKKGIDIDFIILNFYINETKDNIKFVKLTTHRNKFISTFQKKFLRFSLIENSLNLDNYDYLIIRYPGIDFSAFRFVKKFGYKTITEHHTDEVSEAKSANNNIRYFLEKYLSPFFLRKIKAFIAVTQEIEEVELKKIKQKKNSIVISNGIDVENIKFTKFQKFNGKEINILFIASYFSPWHGLDLFLKSLETYNGDIKLRVFIIGNVSANDKKTVKQFEKYENVKIYLEGRKDGEELDNFFQKSNIALSSLALFRKSMKEACALKTREYLARGIPFVYGYIDTDLTGNEEFALRIDVQNEGIEIDKIINFVKKINILKIFH
jgi:glycosyltransferase involved in cell wall biosynthesis